MNEYTITGKEIMGSSPDLRWVRLSNGMPALLKQDIGGRDFLAEQSYATIAEFFGLNVSKCVQFSKTKFASMLSYNKRNTQIDAFTLFAEPTFSSMFKILKESIREEILKLAFVDCVTGNSDRHLGNIAFLSTPKGNIVGLCPPYDNVAVLENSYSDECLLCPDNSKQWTHRDVFVWLSKNWKDFAEYNAKYNSIEFDRCVQSLPWYDNIAQRRDHLQSGL